MYKHYDKDGAAISLHDSCAEKATFENGILTFYFPKCGFIYYMKTKRMIFDAMCLIRNRSERQ